MDINGPTNILGILEGETIGILREKNSERLYPKASAAGEKEIYY